MINRYQLRGLFAGVLAMLFSSYLPAADNALPELVPGWERDTSDAHIQRHPNGHRIFVLPWLTLPPGFDEFLQVTFDLDAGKVSVLSEGEGAIEAVTQNEHMQSDGLFVKTAVRVFDSGAVGIMRYCQRDASYRVFEIVGKSGRVFTEMESLTNRLCATPDAKEDQAVAQTTNKQQQPSPASTEPFATVDQEFTELWWTVRQVASVSGLIPSVKALLVYPDGSASIDVELILSEGIKVSRQQNPKRWRMARIDNGKLVTDRDGQTRKYFGAAKLVPARTGETLDGCWSSNSSFSTGLGIGAGHSFSTRRLCFTPEGRFGDSRSTAVGIAGEGSRANSRSHSRGRYRLDHHLLTLLTDGGGQIVTSFGKFPLEDPDLLIGHRQFEPDEQ